MEENKIMQYKEDVKALRNDLSVYRGFLKRCKDAGINKTKAYIKSVMNAKLLGDAEKAEFLHEALVSEVQIKEQIYSNTHINWNVQVDCEYREVTVKEAIAQLEIVEEMSATADKRIQMFLSTISKLGEAK